MKRKPIRVDWDELEQAFDTKGEDLVYYLDLVTGDVVLEGEGEEAYAPDDDDDPMEEAVEHVAPPREPASHKLYVEPPGIDTELSWMEAFIDESAEIPEEVRGELDTILGRGDPDGFRDALRPHPEARDRWFLYRSERLHDAIDAWLDTNGVQVAEPPPWR